ncbi:DUF3500 domain-containing protein [Nocardioides aquiterrae]|uniref:DUF3500 domain-containing protein n=1 Tax=Nocardioides aquiterrae TaxID=203799 RepID=A0ABN1UC92_9ACTN
MLVPEVGRSRAEIAERMSAAAQAWIDALTAEQRATGCWAGPGGGAAEGERLRWFYTPTDHGGLPLGEQRPAQQRRAMQLLSTGLSTAGYVTAATIMGWENVLDLVEGFSATWGRERARDPGMYYLRVFGEPAADRMWAWRFGGHHLSLNYLVVDGEVRAVTPCFLGADPASGPGLGGALIRPLAQVEDLAHELVGSLDPDQRRRALLLDKAPTDIVGGNRSRLADGDRMIRLPDVWRGHFADPELARKVNQVSDAAEAAAGLTDADHDRLALTRAPQGLAGADLTPSQRELLGALVSTYTGRVPSALSPEVPLDDLHLAWAGSLTPGEPHYYRLQGARFLAEWDNTQRGANHGHSVWRDLANDFGLDVLAAHRAAHH